MSVIEAALIALLGANGALEIGARAMQLGSLLWRRAEPDRPPVSASVGAEAFVSVHLATCTEPPQMVCETLRRLAASADVAFEVIIVDNNTADPSLWRPVEAEAARLGSRFRFVHEDRLEGAKAGALNVALAMADPRTTHVAVVDADYRVHPDFLQDGLDALSRSGADYAQFPQAYRNVGEAARGVEHELGDYFACFAGAAGRAGSMLPTGTLSLFEVGALRAVGGWSSRSITEDAEIGVRLQAAGRRGVWLAQRRGDGLLPLDFAGLRKQRARWAAGNMQVLRDTLSRQPWLGPRTALNLAVQLTAWVSLWALPAAALAVGGGAPGSREASIVSTIAASTILVSAALTAVRLRISARQEAMSWRVWRDAVEAKLALAWTSAVAWIPALTNRSLPFHRTLKALDGSRSGTGPGLALLSVSFAGLAVSYAAHGQAPQVAACGLLALAWPCARKVDADLRQAAASAVS